MEEDTIRFQVGVVDLEEELVIKAQEERELQGKVTTEAQVKAHLITLVVEAEGLPQSEPMLVELKLDQEAQGQLHP